MTVLTAATQHTQQLFVIDKNVDGWRDLVNNAGIGVSVLILDPSQNGLTQLANAITAYTNLDAIHILSHGNIASLQLGSATLNSDNLNHYTEQLTTIGNALNEMGDLLLYGCDVAQGDVGQQFIEQLSVLTGANVAASTNLTGDANQGGDWVLESQTGAIEATSIITEEAQAAYHNTLATTIGLFTATNAANGTELWVTDGTEAGTSLLKDIVVGPISSSPQNITSLGNGKTVFAVTNLTTYYKSYDIWVTDGTAAGTSLVKNSPLQEYHSAGQLFFTTIGNGKALFGGTSGFSDSSGFDGRLWVTDGTAAGTNVVIATNVYYSASIAVLSNGKALFSAYDSTNGSGLWVTDGTTAGTSLLKTFFDGTPNPCSPQYLTSLGNGKVLFSARDVTNGNELWITDGTAAGTGLVKDIVAGTGSSNPQIFTALGNGKAVFDVYNATTGHELWVTDGTVLGTNLVKNGMGSFTSTSFTALGNGKVLFTSTLGLWVSDATAAGTTLVKNIFIGTGDPYSQIMTSLGNGKALFSSYDSTNGYELWVSDGTAAGTNLVMDINAGINSSKPQSFTALGNGKATFSATDVNNDTELWITDGTAAGTSRLKDVNNNGDSSDPQSFATLANGKVLFSAYDAINGTELWVTDGTAVGTGLVKDIFAGITSSNPQLLTSLGNGKVVFKAGVNDNISGNEDLWVSDGTAAGTNLLQAATGNSYPSSIISLNNGKAVFSFYDATNGSELWATDGTVAGTALVKDIFAGISSSDPQSFVSLGNGKVLFDAHTQLWITDGTAAGTALVKDIFADANGAGGIYYAVSITSLGNGKALFSTYNSELWITDGTMAGTSQLQAGTNVFHSTYITSLGNGKAVFTNYDAINGNELWITDGTTAGTVLLKDINVGIADSSPQFITSLGNGKVLFSAYDTNNGSKLWVTDGTTAGTTIFTGTGGYSYLQLGNGKLVFVGNDATNGSELWITDGTAAGTNLVKDIFSGIGSSNPQSFTLLSNGKAVFSAFDAINGTELWITDGTAAGTSLVRDINTLMTQSSFPSAVTFITGTNTNTNTAPTVLAGTTTFFTEQTPVAVSNTITINDPNGDADWNGGTLQVQITTNNTINDGLALPTANNGGIWLNAGNVLMANTTVIGGANVATVNNGSAWLFTFNAAATNALVQDTARAIQFTNNNDTPSTAVRTVMFAATDKNAAFNSAVQTVSVSAVNDMPTLTSFTAAVASGNEDSEIPITFANLQTQGNEADIDGTVTAFVIKAVNSGTLRIGSDALTATAWSASNNTVDASHQAYWTPALNVNGTLNAFTTVAKDNGGLESLTPVQATVSITAVNDAPTLNSFTAVVASGNEDSEIPITFATLQAQGNEADVDSTVAAFVIKAVNTGTLKIGTDALTATAWSATNNSVDASHQAYWTPALNANGTLNAFTAVAKDNGGLESLTPVQATVSITAVNDAPTLTTFTSSIVSGNEDSEIAITFANLQTQGNEADVDGIIIAFVIKAVNSGTLKIGTDAITATAWSATNNTVDVSHQAYWTPALNANGTLNAFTAVAKDNGGLESITPVQATISITAVNDAPSGANKIITLNENSRYTLVASDFGFNDIDGNTLLSVTISNLPSVGSLKLNGVSVVANAHISVSDINNSLLTFSPVANANGIGYASMTFQVQDNGGTVNGGVDLAVSTNTLGFNVAVSSNHIIGTAGNDVLTGGVGNNILDGLAGADTMLGGAGDDSYMIDNIGDVVVENVGAGTDTVYSSVSYSLAVNIENLILTSDSAINGAGNGLNNQLTGNSADNVLSGYGGVDTMIGGLGNDTYGVNNINDVVIENAGEGTDTVSSVATSYILTANVENLVLNGTAAINGAGNGLNNQLTGNSADNVLSGYGGVDTMIGGFGNDTYGVNDINDVVIENVGEGTDMVVSIATSYILATNVENLVLGGTAAINGTGNTLNNQLTGNSTNNILDGLAGADTMLGGAGDDGYRVDNTSDMVVENASEGLDTVYSVASYTLAANVENLILTGTAAINGAGNGLNNQLTGNSADNVLSGYGGVDTMIGSLGNDTYGVDNVNDSIIENSAEGWDVVYSRASSYTLSTSVEQLILTGTAAINGTGSADNNILNGNVGDNVLDGQGGADILIGGLGKDTYNLTETNPAVDTLTIATGDSLVNSYDVAQGFKLGTGNGNQAGVDRLDLDSIFIAANTVAVNGVDAGTVRSHSISNGIISFDDTNNYSTPITISAATNLANVISYLQTNITGGNTVAFIADTNTYVFQDGGATDTLVELVGVVASSVNNTGLTTNSVWVI